jgi:hypothetical protein
MDKVQKHNSFKKVDAVYGPYGIKMCVIYGQKHLTS